MDTNQLRLGNLVWSNDGHFNHVEDVITDIEEMRVGTKYSRLPYLSDFDIEPIPLTDEWLNKFGFTEAMFDYTIHTGEFYKGSVGILSIAGNTGKFQLQYEMKCTQTTIKYVHQLQNLFFALTGVELLLTAP